MSEMVDRVADAVSELELNGPIDLHLNVETSQLYLAPKAAIAVARAAIEAMREPTEEMYDALSARDKMWRDTNSTEVWQALIDGALK
jgi:hypothetical protein